LSGLKVDDLPGTVLWFRRVDENYVEAVVEQGNQLAKIEVNSGKVSLTTSGPEVNAAFKTSVLSLFPKLVHSLDPPTPEVMMTFWLNDARNGASKFARTLSVPPWESARHNYTATTRTQLSHLTSWQPHSEGRLLLFHGAPGTGKTNAIRSLAWEWRKWAACEYITNPEEFFGRSDYMMHIMFSQNELSAAYIPGEVPTSSDSRTASPTWRLLLLEDASELLSVDAKEKTGQGLSRLLNLVDGLMGQSTNLLTLITTNEPLEKLHPAVSRPGRCAANIHFGLLDAAEQRAWQTQEQCTADVSTPCTIAEMYAKKHEWTVQRGVPPSRSAGFGGSERLDPVSLPVPTGGLIRTRRRE
jgi:hypothetical protein